MFVLKSIILFFYVMFLIQRGFFGKPGFASWHMFASSVFTEFDLWIILDNSSKERFNPWKFLPHTHIVMQEQEAKIFLLYLRKIHNLKLEGTICIKKGLKVKSYLVKNSYVVD